MSLASLSYFSNIKLYVEPIRILFWISALLLFSKLCIALYVIVIGVSNVSIIIWYCCVVMCCISQTFYTKVWDYTFSVTINNIFSHNSISISNTSTLSQNPQKNLFHIICDSNFITFAHFYISRYFVKDAWQPTQSKILIII